MRRRAGLLQGISTARRVRRFQQIGARVGAASLSLEMAIALPGCGLDKPDFGLSAALFGHIMVTVSRVEQSNFHGYRALCVNEIPVMEHVLPSDGDLIAALASLPPS